MGAFLDKVGSSGLEPLFRLWCARRPAGDIPPRESFQIWDIPPGLLPNLFLYAKEGDRFRCRLFGTTLVTIFGEEATGRTLDELIPAAALPTRQALFERVLETGLPLHYEGNLVARDREWRRFSRLMLPVSKAGRPDHVMGAVTFPSMLGAQDSSDEPTADLAWVEATEEECRC